LLQARARRGAGGKGTSADDDARSSCVFREGEEERSEQKANTACCFFRVHLLRRERLGVMCARPLMDTCVSSACVVVACEREDNKGARVMCLLVRRAGEQQRETGAAALVVSSVVLLSASSLLFPLPLSMHNAAPRSISLFRVHVYTVTSDMCGRGSALSRCALRRRARRQASVRRCWPVAAALCLSLAISLYGRALALTLALHHHRDRPFVTQHQYRVSHQSVQPTRAHQGPRTRPIKKARFKPRDEHGAARRARL